MQIEVLKCSLTETLCDTLIMYVYSDGVSPTGQAAEVNVLLHGQLSSLLLDQPTMGKLGEITIVHTLNLITAKRIIMAGLGKRSDVTNDKLRSVTGAAVRAARQQGAISLALDSGDLPGELLAEAVLAVTEGALLGSYQFNDYKTDKKNEKRLERFIFTSSSDSNISLLVQTTNKAKVIADSVLLARNLVNHPANVMTPAAMSEKALDIAHQYGLEVHILEKAEIEKLNMKAFLAVAQGTQEPPRLIVLKYTGNAAKPGYISFIGKGVTFDSGGISLKPSEGMEEMKTDMAGGAAVLGAISGIAELKLKLNIIALVPCTENMPSGISLKPGDVISSMAGKSIEVVNTDAEGRLLLADAVTYAKQLGAEKLVDLATLTGACVVALGSVTSGVISNNDEWCNRVLNAANNCGEKMWRLPAFDEYKEQIKSPIADLKNSGGRPAGAITAGLFIAEFAADTPWVHIDIAGTATVTKDSGYNVKGATGAGVRTLIQLACDLANHDS